MFITAELESLHFWLIHTLCIFNLCFCRWYNGKAKYPCQDDAKETCWIKSDVILNLFQKIMIFAVLLLLLLAFILQQQVAFTSLCPESYFLLVHPCVLVYVAIFLFDHSDHPCWSFLLLLVFGKKKKCWTRPYKPPQSHTVLSVKWMEVPALSADDHHHIIKIISSKYPSMQWAQRNIQGAAVGAYKIMPH